MQVGIRVPDDMPCKRSCPDRYPGCHCDKKKEWDKKHAAKKQMIREAKDKDNLIMSTIMPDKNMKAR